MISYSVSLTKSARKELDKLSERVQERIADLLKMLAINPFSELLQVKKLKGERDLYRARVGDYRVVYCVINSEVHVVVIKIGHRKDVYREL